MTNKPTPPAVPTATNTTPATYVPPKTPTYPQYKPELPIDKVLLLKVFKIQNPSHNRACNNATMDTIASLAPAGCTIVRNGGNMLIRKGPAIGPHPYFLAHMDQVHDYVPYMRLVVNGDELSALDGNGEQCGVGGDDKCGIYLALLMLQLLDHVTCVFVRDEETGCHGSRVVPLAWFDNASFVIQADRNNASYDIIPRTNGMLCASDEFMKTILDLPACVNHRSATGSITDIGELASRGLEVSMVNISSGYHDPHTEWETVDMRQLRIACDVAYQMATRHGNVRWPNQPEEIYRTYGGYDGYGWGSHSSKVGAQSSRLTGNTAGMSRNELDEWVWLSSETAVIPKDHRDRIIGQLVTYFGLDRELDALDHQTTSTLESLLYSENGLVYDDLDDTPFPEDTELEDHLDSQLDRALRDL